MDLFTLWFSWLLLLCTVDATGSTQARILGDQEPNELFTEHVFSHRHSFFRRFVSDGPAASFEVKESADLQSLLPASVGFNQFTLRSHGNTARILSRLDDPIHHNSQYLLEEGGDDPLSWPNASDKRTVVNLAKMTSDAYLFDPNGSGWLNTSQGFNFTWNFGWFDDGLRGHVFATKDEKHVVVSFKGTTIDPRDKISGRDQENDNRLFSCCCGAQNPYHYAPACNCSIAFNQCNANCVTQSVLQEESYYAAALFVMEWAKSFYPNSTFWTVGHSLGGAIAALVGYTLDIPSVTFEAPPERLPAQRMGLISNNTMTKANRAIAHHFGNTADPVFTGDCYGIFSLCSFWGFSFESKCHSGKRCTYDTVKDKGWSVSVNHHRILNVIPNVLEAYDNVPKCEEVKNCTDCADWTFK